MNFKKTIVCIMSAFLISPIIAKTENDQFKNNDRIYQPDFEKYKKLYFGGNQHFDQSLIAPSAYFDGKTIVLAGEDSSDDHNLFYRTGSLGENVDNITWNQAGGYPLDTVGVGPKIAVTENGTIVEVHQSQTTEEKRLFYRTGKLSDDKKTIQWYDWYTQYDSGETPNIVATGNKIIEVHSGSGKLYYRIADVSDDHKLYWKSATGQYYDSGFSPNITIVDNKIFEAHSSSSGNKTESDLFYRTGILKGDQISWYQNEGAYKFSNGGAPAVTTIKGSNIMVAYYNELPLIKPSGDHSTLQMIHYRTGKFNENNGIDWFQQEDNRDNSIISCDTGGHESCDEVTSYSLMSTDKSVFLFSGSHDVGSFFKGASI